MERIFWPLPSTISQQSGHCDISSFIASEWPRLAAMWRGVFLSSLSASNYLRNCKLLLHAEQFYHMGHHQLAIYKFLRFQTPSQHILSLQPGKVESLRRYWRDVKTPDLLVSTIQPHQGDDSALPRARPCL
ncbi:hypothetical protein F0562_035422 [Nyssa sinensis]|uniref:Uncharacterized protein n=1 Tax=Nyssa sinensis TaxID=561372 RepID=A0A5J5AC87_9ASTE|nr:hypothetical protein F0562_035422 [Nyssa sinensis]